MTTRPRPRVLIVGAGLVGCALAIYLARRGLAVRVYERHGDPRTAERSRRASLTLSLCTRGIRSLERIGLMDRIGPLLAPASGRMIHAPDGTTSYQPYSAFGDAIHCLSRRDLGSALLDAAGAEGVEILFAHRCTAVDPVAGTIDIEDHAGRGRRDQASVVFGADGCFSAIRRHLQQAGWCRASERIADDGYKEFRVPAAAAAAAGLRPDVLHAWPREPFIAGAFPDRDGSFCGTLHMPMSGAQSFETIGDRSACAALFDRHGRELLQASPDLIDDLIAQRPNSIVSVTCRPWSAAGRVLLIGDAAHAMLPYWGQGANAGFQDCEILDDLLARYDTDWPRIFAEFERGRAPDLAAMAELCREQLTMLRERVTESGFQAQWRLEQQLHRLVPEVFTPLYSMIAFSSMSYAEARERHRVQEDVIRDLLIDPAVAQRLTASTARALFSRAFDAGVAHV